MLKTTEEKNIQIEGLKKDKLKFPEFSAFGDKNWEKIDAKLDVLEGLKNPDDFWQDESDEDYQDGDNDIYNAAIEAEEWMQGNIDDNLFSQD